MRVTKEHEERRSEILDVAQNLFYTKGYMKTTIIDILNEVGIAKGTFYYYFKSKEEVLDAIIERVSNQETAKALKVVEDTKLTAYEKLFRVLMGQKEEESRDKQELIEQINQVENIEMQHKSMIQTIKCLTPIFESIIRQGMLEETMDTRYPRETVEFILITALSIFDRDIISGMGEDARVQQIQAFVYLTERLIGAPEGALNEIIGYLNA